MVTPVLHRKWAREYLARAEEAQSRTRKCQYLRLAVSNTVCARKLESETTERATQDMEAGSAEDSPTPKH
jgi:hypothetical protein